MNHAGDAAEQVVRMSLEGAEVALKITGVAAKNLAAALYTILKDQKKTKGKARIEAMLREKRPLKVYTLKKEDCPEFARQAKGYGILYAPIPVRKGDDTIDILVFEDDAARANRIVDKFNLTVVDTASIKEDIEKSREERGGEPQAPEKAAPEKSEDDRLLRRVSDLPQSGRLPAQAGTRPGGAEGAESHGLSHPRCRAERENLSSPRRKTARKHKDVEGGMENGAAGGTERSCLSAVLEIFPAKGPGALRNGGICFEHEQRKADEACRARPKAYRILSMEPGAGCAG